jgi:transposase
MVKRDGEWYAHFVLKKVVEVPDEPETVIAIDRGERNLAVAVAISKEKPEQADEGQLLERRRGEEDKGEVRACKEENAEEEADEGC